MKKYFGGDFPAFLGEDEKEELLNRIKNNHIIPRDSSSKNQELYSGGREMKETKFQPILKDSKLPGHFC